MTDPDTAALVLSVLGDAGAEVEYRRQLVREAVERARDRGFAQGVATMATAYKRQLLGEYDNAVLEAARYTVPCRDCRRGGRREGCTRCEVRDRDTFGLPHPDDYAPAALILERAS